jgi:hypothetical protein
MMEEGIEALRVELLGLEAQQPPLARQLKRVD